MGSIEAPMFKQLHLRQHYPALLRPDVCQAFGCASSSRLAPGWFPTQQHVNSTILPAATNFCIMMQREYYAATRLEITSTPLVYTAHAIVPY